jgi:hypothetical protein
MGVGADAMVVLATLPRRVDVDECGSEMGDLVKELVADFHRHFVPLVHREVARHRDADFHVKPVADPARPHVRDLIDVADVGGGMVHRLQRLVLNAVEHAKEN